MIKLRIKQLCADRDITRKQLAEMCCKPDKTDLSSTYQAISNLANGKVPFISIELLDKLLTALDCTPNELIKHEQTHKLGG